MTLLNYISICDSMVQLMHPLLEIVIHEIESGKICYINGNLSKRCVGDPSLLDRDILKKQDLDKIIYPKINFDGKLIKSISIILEKKWLLCINADVSLFNQMNQLSKIFLNASSLDQPKSLLANDWQEKVHAAMHDYLQQQNFKFEHLSSADKKSLARHLFDLGAFDEKNAADYVAKLLELGRATIFKYLKEWRDK